MTTLSYQLVGGTVEIDKKYSAIQQAKRMMFLDTAEGVYLTRLAADLGVPRTLLVGDDENFRKVVQVCGLPKGILLTIIRLLEVTLGSKADLISEGLRPWVIYEINNLEFVIELPGEVIATDQERASYLHGFYSFVLDGSTDEILLVQGDATTSASDIVGLDITITFSDGAIDTQTISDATYDAATDITTITVAAVSQTPVGGDKISITIPGDEISSQRGDYLAPSKASFSFTTAAGPDTSTITVQGDATTLFDDDLPVFVSYNGTTEETNIITVSDYNLTTHTTTIIISATIPGDTEGLLFRDIEIADQETTLPHNDRIYLQRYGKYEVTDFYLKLIVIAAGVSLRVELI